MTETIRFQTFFLMAVSLIVVRCDGKENPCTDASENDHEKLIFLYSSTVPGHCPFKAIGGALPWRSCPDQRIAT
jgi:hypothetical protein